MKYKLLFGGNHSLDWQVNQHLSEGWELYGSPAVSWGQEYDLICQAVVLKDDPVPPLKKRSYKRRKKAKA